MSDLSSTHDESTLTRAERESERARRRSFKEAPPHASRVIARIRHARMEKPVKVKSPCISKKHPVTGRPRTAPVKALARRCFVRVRYANAKQKGQWAAHGKYLEREGAQQEGQRGSGFGASTDDVSLSATAAQWQGAGDDKIFKLVLSPEDGNRLDLRDWTRRTMSRVQQQTGQPLEWVAIDHHNTGTDHVHVLLRGAGLTLSNELMTAGIRDIAGDEATRDLGYRTQADLSLARDREIEQRRFTSIDREIQAKIAVPDPGTPGAFLATEPPAAAGRVSVNQADQRRQRIARLQALETIGVAERVGHMTWRLDPGWDKALKELEVLQTRSTMLMQHRELLSDPRALPVVTKLQPGDRLTGRVLGTGLDDARDAPYILIEGADGKAHFIAQNAKIEQHRSERRLMPGALVTLECRTSSSGKAVLDSTDHGLSIPARGFTKIEIPEAVLDSDLKHRAENRIELPSPAATVGFAAHYQRSLNERSRERAKLQRDRGDRNEVAR